MTKFNHFEQLQGFKNEIFLPKDFPVTGGKLYEQSDEDITVLHFHQCFELGYCYEGSGIFMINDQIYPFVAGDASLIQAGVFHLAKSSKGTSSKWRFLFLDAKILTEFMKSLTNQFYEKQVLSINSKILKQGQQAQSIFYIKRVIEEFVEQKNNFATAMQLNLSQLAITMQRQENSSLEVRTFDREKFNKISAAIDLMFRDYARPLSIEILAESCHLSATQFRRVFLATMGVTPQKYLTTLRLQQAEQLLQSPKLKVVDIAQQVGFSTLSAFNRAFRLTKACSPQKLRKTLIKE